MMRRGFTIIELVVVIAIVVVAVSLLIPTKAGSSRSPELKDATKLRGIWQALNVWAGYSEGKYPLPSAMDLANATIADLGPTKDTTGNIMSILAFEGMITTEMLISSSENNKNISDYELYEEEEPQTAADPFRALWDPGLSANFTAEAGGHISFAHLIPVGRRLDMWTSTGKANEAILSNRGPEIASVERAGGKATTAFANPDTLTTRFFAESNDSWTGNIVYNDGHVSFAKNLYTHNANVGTTSFHRPLSITNDDGTTTDYHDVLFADEEGFESNQFLGIFTTAGESKEDYTAIWD